MDRALIQVLQRQGVVFAAGLSPVEILEPWKDDFGLAMDAQPSLITTSNAGIPAFLSNVIDPQVVRVITQPMRAAEIYGETKKGDWTMLSTQFPVVESTGEVSSYGDYNNNGSSGANVNFVPRQSYHFQTISQYGERELEMYGLAKISYKSEIDIASALVLNKYHNLTYFFGVQGLINYGGLNDPSLIAPITPAAKAGGGFTWVTATPDEEYQDVLNLFAQLQSQMGGNIDVTETMTLALSPGRQALLQKTNQFGINVIDLLKKNFPNLTIKTAPEYATVAGELMQLILNNFEGVQTAYAAFTEKMRAHPVIPGLSNFSQKKSAGTWGTVIRRPICIAQMLGI